MANKIFVVHLQTQTKRGSLGSLAQLVQSVCLTSRGSGVRLPQLPQRIKQLQKCSCFFRVRKSRKRGEVDNPGDEIIQPNAPSSHVVADEITWEQYILKKCPCRQVERRFSETHRSQVFPSCAVSFSCAADLQSGADVTIFLTPRRSTALQEPAGHIGCTGEFYEGKVDIHRSHLNGAEHLSRTEAPDILSAVSAPY